MRDIVTVMNLLMIIVVIADTLSTVASEKKDDVGDGCGYK